MKPNVILMLGALMLCGCVERTLTLNTTPPGALVYMNDQEVGRTPLTRDFEWYGNYEVIVRAEGYETLKTTSNLKAPWWQWIPLDLFAAILPIPFKDHQQFTYTLTPASTQPVNPDLLMNRGLQLQQELESSHFTPTTAPATAPAAP
jgi:hypothetical protein